MLHRSQRPSPAGSINSANGRGCVHSNRLMPRRPRHAPRAPPRPLLSFPMVTNAEFSVPQDSLTAPAKIARHAPPQAVQVEERLAPFPGHPRDRSRPRMGGGILARQRATVSLTLAPPPPRRCHTLRRHSRGHCVPLNPHLPPAPPSPSFRPSPDHGGCHPGPQRDRHAGAASQQAQISTRPATRAPPPQRGWAAGLHRLL